MPVHEIPRGLEDPFPTPNRKIKKLRVPEGREAFSRGATLMRLWGNTPAQNKKSVVMTTDDRASLTLVQVLRLVQDWTPLLYPLPR